MPPLATVSKRVTSGSIVPTGRYPRECGKDGASFGRTTRSESKNNTSADVVPNTNTAAGIANAHAPRSPARVTAEAARNPASTPTSASKTLLGRDNSSFVWHDGHSSSSDRDTNSVRGTFAKHNGHARFDIRPSPFTFFTATRY